MITKQELIEYSKRRNINLGQSEVDYFQHIILFILYTKLDSQLIFKGGTALQKCYNLERFSEDLDFNTNKEQDIKTVIESGLKDFFIEHETEINEHPKGRNFIFRIRGPLYNGNRNSLCKILIDLSSRESTKLPPKTITIAKTINEIPSFQVIAMDQEEILAEKIRAILTRDKARDIYDLSYLLDQGISQNKKLINEKLEFDKIEFSKNKLIKEIEKKKHLWEFEMKPLLNNFVEFEEIFDNIKEKLA